MFLPRIIFLFPFFYCFAHAQQVFLPLGANANAQAGVSTVQANAFSVQNNPALIASLKNFEIGIDNKLPFLQKNLATANISAVKPYKFFNAGFALTQFGYALFNQQRISLALAKKLSKTFSLGVNFTYLSTNIFEQPHQGNLIGELGFLFEPTPKIKLGFFALNLTQAKYRAELDERIPSLIRVGLGYEIAKELHLNSEYEQFLNQQANLKVSLNYQLNTTIDFMCGWASNPVNIGFGSNIHYKKIQFVFAANMHQALGLTPSLSLLYKGK